MNKKIMMIVVAVVLVGVGFYGGMLYGQSKIPATNQGFRTGNFSGGPNGMRGAGRAGGGTAFGQILSIDTTGVTVKLQDGSSKIILISGSTPIMKEVSGTSTDLVVGKQISVRGTANTDGSITANSVQLLTATTTRPIGQ